MEKYTEQCIQIIDENGDNKVSLEEFTTWWMAGSKGIHGFLRNSFLTTCNIVTKINKSAKFSHVTNYPGCKSEMIVKYNPLKTKWTDLETCTEYNFSAQFKKMKSQPADITIELEVDPNHPIIPPQGWKPSGLEFQVQKETGRECTKVLTFENNKQEGTKHSIVKIEMKISEEQNDLSNLSENQLVKEARKGRQS